MMNVGNPEEAFRLSLIPCDGVGLAREEFIISTYIKIHPQALLNYGKLDDPAVKGEIDRLTAGFPPGEFDAIISNAGGCGSHLKHYSKLLHDDPEYVERAKIWDAKLKDIHEWLIEIGVQPPLADHAPEQVVTYHESCHLCHGQKITSQPRQLLQTIPNLKLIELPESSWCCGSAGIYNIIQPEMANELLARKLRHVQSTGASIVATGNPGCLLQVLNGAKQRNLPLRLVHPVTLLAEAYRRADASR